MIASIKDCIWGKQEYDGIVDNPRPSWSVLDVVTSPPTTTLYFGLIGLSATWLGPHNSEEIFLYESQK